MQSSIQVGVNGPAVWVRVEGKGSFLNSGNFKEFAREMVNRGYREFVVDLDNCAMMDSTFMGTMAGVALALEGTGPGTSPRRALRRAQPRICFPAWGSIRFSAFKPTAQLRRSANCSAEAEAAESPEEKKAGAEPRQCSMRTRRCARRRRKISPVQRRSRLPKARPPSRDSAK